MAAWAFFDALAPNVALRIIGPFVKLGWRVREKRPINRRDALSEPLTKSEIDGDLSSRSSIVGKLQDLAQVGR